MWVFCGGFLMGLLVVAVVVVVVFPHMMMNKTFAAIIVCNG